MQLNQKYRKIQLFSITEVDVYIVMIEVEVVVVVKIPDTMDEMRLLIPPPKIGLATRTFSCDFPNEGAMAEGDSFTSAMLGLWVLRNWGSIVGSKLKLILKVNPLPTAAKLLTNGLAYTSTLG